MLSDLRIRLQAAIRGMSLAEDPDPRWLQAGFLVIVSCELGLRLIAGAQIGLRSWPALAMALLAAVTAASLSMPDRRRIARVDVYIVVALIDLTAIGLTRLSPDGSVASILVVLPAIWLGGQYGQRGAYGAGLASVLLVAAPGVAYAGISGPGLARAVMPPVIAVTAGLGMASGIRRAEAERDQANRRGLELAEALETIEHHRRTAEAILDTVDVGLVLLDHTGRYVGTNKHHQDFMDLAYPDGHDGQAGQTGLVYQADGETFMGREEMPTIRASQGEEFDDIRLWTGNDPLTRKAVSVSARSMRDASGNYAGSALAYKDVTDYVRAMAIKDDFVASVSHELRTPLTSISGYVSVLLERDDLSAQARSHLLVVERNAERLERLVGDLLATAQADADSTILERTPSDLSVLVRESVEAAEPAAAAAGVEVRVDTPCTVDVLVDRRRLGQVVDNLLSNALKHTQAGGRVSVCLGVSSETIELDITDTGAGIEESEREQLFTRFFRSRYSRQQAVPGIGLGLVITRDIVVAHGGRIELDSEPGHGTTVRVLLPAAGTLLPPLVESSA